MNSPEIQNPKNVQDALNTMQTKQKAYSEQRLKILEQVRLDSSINEANFYKVIKNTDQLKINGI